MKKDGITPQMPPISMPHIIARLTEIGMTEAVGMGVGPLSWVSIDAWKRGTGIRIPPWEARLIRQLSEAYLAEGRKAEDETCPPPWRAPVSRRERELEARALDMVLG